MKRGLIAWDKAELPPEAFEARLARVRKELAMRYLPAMVVYSDVWQSNRGRYFSNFMPYWNRALIVIPAAGKPVLLCSLSQRVYPWIKSVTIFEEIKPSPNLPQRVFEMCAEKGWTKIGVWDLASLPNDLHTQLRNGEVAMDDVSWHPATDHWELAMYRRAARVTREGLHAEMSGSADLVDHEFVARLEHRFRRAGAEDLVVLVTNGTSPPAPPTGALLGDSFSASVALEYRGHWVKIIRNKAGFTGPAHSYRKEDLSGRYPYQSTQPGGAPGTVYAARTEMRQDGLRLFYGDSYVQGASGAELL
jgi:hypothetical protein